MELILKLIRVNKSGQSIKFIFIYYLFLYVFIFIKLIQLSKQTFQFIIHKYFTK